MSTGGPRILLTEGSSASAREILTVLGRAGHRVDVLDGGGSAFTAGSRWVDVRHRVAPFSAGPLAWLDALTDVLRRTRYDVLLPTHEQLVAVSRRRAELADLVDGLAVPDFAAVALLVDKVETARLLDRLGLPQPDMRTAADATELARTRWFPCFVKLPVATGSQGVWAAEDVMDLVRIADRPEVRAAWAAGEVVLVQRGLPGPLLMASAVFDRGRVVARHAVRRVRDGVAGSAAAKESTVLPELAEQLAVLGGALDWHGPLSVDAVLDGGVARWIGVDPRLVEPVNGELAGAELVERWLAVSRGEPVGPLPAARSGVRTHQTVMAALGAAQDGRGRRGVLRELVACSTGRGSAEELLAVRGDPATAGPLALVAACLLAHPGSWRRLASSGPPRHALSPRGWRELR